MSRVKMRNEMEMEMGGKEKMQWKALRLCVYI